jgi:uncharacterized integral membrane protein
VKVVIRFVTMLAIIAALVLAVANRHEVDFRLDPLPFEIELKLFWIILVSVFLGALIGAGTVWWRDGKVRRRARRAGREVTRLETELQAARSTSQLPAPTGSPGAAE